MLFLGLDVGGVNVKAALLKASDGKIEALKTASTYFPIWREGKNRLPKALRKTWESLKPGGRPELLALTMTAEVSDVYRNKREGVLHVLSCVEEVWRETPKVVVDVKGNLVGLEEARGKPLKVASANWAASGWLVSRLLEEALLVDVGSTTTTIVPVREGRVEALGETDLEKLHLGELVYSGALRTNVASIVQRLEVKGKPTRVSSEYFASTGDVYLALGEIKEDDYTVETADGRGKTREEALARLARTVCADLEMLGERETLNIAFQVAWEQVNQLAEALNHVFLDHWDEAWRGKLTVVTAGVKGGFLAEKAAHQAGFSKTVCIDSLLGFKVSRVLPAAALAFLAASKRLGVNP